MEKEMGWGDNLDRLAVSHLVSTVCVCVQRRGCSDALVVWIIELWVSELSH